MPWKQQQRKMYERVATVPRLMAFYDVGDSLPDPILSQAMQDLNAHYAGRSVRYRGPELLPRRPRQRRLAGDYIGRTSNDDFLVAVVSLGAARALQLRPRNRDGATLRFQLGHGDPFVMGGSAQRTWEHTVPKTTRDVGQRISIQFRPADIRSRKVMR